MHSALSVRRFGLVTVAILAALLAGGCSTTHPKAYNKLDAPSRVVTKQTNGLQMSVDVVLDKSRNKKYFGTYTVANGIVPVFVRIENLSAPGSVLVEKEQFQISVNETSNGGSPLDGSVQHSSKTGAVVGGAGILLLSGPLIIVGSAMISTADEIKHNFVEKELRNQSLARGRSVEGFVYCMHQRKEPISDVLVSLPLRDLQTEQQIKCDFLIKNENK